MVKPNDLFNFLGVRAILQFNEAEGCSILVGYFVLVKGLDNSKVQLKGIDRNTQGSQAEKV